MLLIIPSSLLCPLNILPCIGQLLLRLIQGFTGTGKFHLLLSLISSRTEGIKDKGSFSVRKLFYLLFQLLRPVGQLVTLLLSSLKCLRRPYLLLAYCLPLILLIVFLLCFRSV